jgi:hypothetical protein
MTLEVPATNEIRQRELRPGGASRIKHGFDVAKDSGAVFGHDKVSRVAMLGISMWKKGARRSLAAANSRLQIGDTRIRHHE